MSDDVPELYPALNRATASLGVPWLHTAGNMMSMSMRGTTKPRCPFRAVWAGHLRVETDRAVFVVLDNVVSMPGRRPSYIGGLRGDQFDFWSYLPLAPLIGAGGGRAHPVVRYRRAGQAIDGARGRSCAAVRPARVRTLLLSGHRHTQRRSSTMPGPDGRGGLRE